MLFDYYYYLSLSFKIRSMDRLTRDYDLFIFDWDGTLSTSTFLVKFTHFFKKRYNIEYVLNHKKEYNRSFKRVNISKSSSISRFVDFFYEIYAHFIRPKPRVDSKMVLEYLKKRKKTIALLSDGKQSRVFKELKMLGMQEYFDIVVCAGALGYFKPNPTGLNLIVRELKKSKKRSIYIGDMATDVLTAKFAGITSCSVCGGVDPCELIKRAKPDYSFTSLRDFLKAIKK